MAKVDLKRALELAETIKDSTTQDWVFANIISQRLKIDPESALPLLERIKNLETKARMLATSAKAMTQKSPDKAQKLLLEAVDALKQVTAPRSRLYISMPAMQAAKSLGMEEIQQQLMEVIRETAVISGNDGLLRIAGVSLAEVNPKVALSVVNHIQDDNDRYHALADVTKKIAESDVHAAQNRLFWIQSLIDPRFNSGSHYWASAAKDVAVKLAESDVQEALLLTRQIPAEEGAKAIALAKIATKIATDDRQKALDIFSEAVAAAHLIRDGAWPPRLAELARVGHMFSLLDVERAKELFSELPQSRVKQIDRQPVAEYVGLSQREFASIAFYMADVSPDRARNIIEEIVKEANRYVVVDEKRAYLLQAAAQAAIRLDVPWAIEIARSIDPTAGERRQNYKAETLRKLAQYLIATPADRGEIHFGRWMASDTWSPGEETNW